MTHSNWGNAVQLHIGSNAGAVIETMKTLTAEDSEKLLKQYRKIQEYCDRQNEELGLDIFTDAGAYRFALAVPLTGLPKFIQLPPFDTYEYDSVMSSNAVTLEKSTEQTITESTTVQTLPTVACPHCGSIDVFKNGVTTKGEQYFSCNKCEGKPKKWRAPKSTNSN